MLGNIFSFLFLSQINAAFLLATYCIVNRILTNQSNSEMSKRKEKKKWNEGLSFSFREIIET